MKTDQNTTHGYSVGTYLAVYVALLVFLGLTVWASGLELGRWNIFIAMAIAAVKAALVVLFFMQAKKSTWIIQFYACAAVVWLLIATVLTFADYAMRRPLQANLLGTVTVAEAPSESSQGAVQP